MIHKKQYAQRFQQVLDYIDIHLDKPIDLTRLASIAHFSKYHFQRQFSACFGLSATQYIAQLRLNRSAHLLAFYQQPICDIAFKNQFYSQEAFSRAFKIKFGTSPLKFRRLTPWESWHCYPPVLQLREQIMQINKKDLVVDIVNFPFTNIAVLVHLGDPKLIMRSVAQFIEWRKSQGNLSPTTSDTFNILYHDPAMVPIDEYRFDIACSVTDAICENKEGVINDVLESCRCAMMNLTGSNDDMEQAIQYLYGEWLPNNEEECSDKPLFVKRLKMYPNVAMHEQEFEVYLPLN